MTRYTGNHCPVCEQAFTDTDDIVVCPDCGTRNTPGAARCSHCGCPLPRSDADSADAAKPEEQVPIYARDPSAVNNRSAAPGPHIETYSADREGGIYRREIGPEDTIDGIKAKDWAAYVGRSPMYYLMQFFRMSITNRKAAVCLSAFLFGPAYLFYRKMWKEGLLTAILTIVLSIPTFIEIISVFNPSLLGAMPLGWLPAAVNVCAVASWALNIILGLFAVSWYRREAKKNIDRIYADYPDGEARTDALLQKGGTNLLAALLYFGIMLLLASLVINLAGPGFVQYALSISGY